MKRLVSTLLASILVACGGASSTTHVESSPERRPQPELTPGPQTVPPASTSTVPATASDTTPPTGCPGVGGGFGPVILDETQAGSRWMATQTLITSVQSSKENPVEVCGVQGELGWLLAVTCPDGTHPYTDAELAHNSRLGNVGEGGRCGSVIDLYPVPCGGDVYEVYMDMYMCTQAEVNIAFSYMM